MPIEITMPQLSDTMAEGTLIKWRKSEGQKVKQGEVIAEVETDKATMEMEAFESGTLAHILVTEGQKAPVGAVLALLAGAGEKVGDIKKGGAATAAAPAEKAQGSSKTAGTAQRELQADSSDTSTTTLEDASSGEMHERADVGHGATRQAPTAVPPLATGPDESHRIMASPVARRVAASRGIDLASVRGSGPNGRIIEADIENFRTTTGPRPAPTAVKSGGNASSRDGEDRVVELSKMRLVIAKRLQQSKQVLPHYYETTDIDVDDLMQLRARLNDQLKSDNVKLSLGDLIAKGVVAALLRHPILNATFDGTHVTEHADVSLGMAVALENGLIVPVLRGISQMGLREIRERSADLIDRARAQRLKQDELSGATFTVSNLGAYGIREFTAIINPPEVAILAVGAASKRAVVRDDTIVARHILSVTLSSDHRVVDGAVAAAFLQTLRALLEDPASMLL